MMYNGPGLQLIKMTEATVLDFEIIVLEQYLKVVQLVEKQRRLKGLKDFRDEERTPAESWREKFI